MFLGRVAGTVWSTVKWPQAVGIKLLLVRPYRLGDLFSVEPSKGSTPPAMSEGGQSPPSLDASAPGVAGGAGQAGAASEPTDDLVVCADTLDAGPGDDVIVAFGHAARVAISDKLPPGTKPSVPIDAAIVAVVDRVDLSDADAGGGG